MQGPPNASFCPLPWVHTALEPDGSTKLCCIANGAEARMNPRPSVHDAPLAELHARPALQTVRREMLEGSRVPECARCTLAEKVTGTSRRLRVWQHYRDGRYGTPLSFEDLRAQTLSRGLSGLPLGYLHLNFGNLCNLACRMCGPQYSSRIADDPVHASFGLSDDHFSPLRWKSDHLTIFPSHGTGWWFSGFTPGLQRRTPQGPRPLMEVGADAFVEVLGLDAPLVRGVLHFVNPGQQVVELEVDAPLLGPHRLRVNPGWQQFSLGLNNQPFRGAWRLTVRHSGGSKLYLERLRLERVSASEEDSAAQTARPESLGRLGGQAWHRHEGPSLREILALAPGLRQLNINGGEPFINRQAIRLLEALIVQGHAEHIRLAFNSNCTRVDDSLLALFDAFPSVQVSASIDGLGALNEYIRHGSNWKVLVRNLERLRAHRRVGVQITPSVQALNVFGLLPLLQWAEAEGFGWTCFNILDGPAYVSLDAVPPRLPRMAADRLDAWTGSGACPPQGIVDLAQVTARLRAPLPGNHQEIRERFLEFTRALDVDRGQRLEDVAPELAQA